MSAGAMTLRYLPANAAYVFTFGDALIRMGDARMFHDTRRDAVRAALACGLQVERNGRVVAMGSTVTITGA